MLQKHFHVQEISMDEWPFWMFEENIKLVNEISEEEEASRKKQEKEQQSSMPNFDPNSMLNNMKNNIPKF